MFLFFISIVIVQRLIELKIARRNEYSMRAQGAYEVGAHHYPYMIALHVGFLLFLIVEVVVDQQPLSPFFHILLLLFLITQAVRLWCIYSLGSFWNTKILILPNSTVVRKGPYRFMRHPNYFIVSLEIILLPLMFQAYFCAFIFSLFNAILLMIRIPMEEQALREATNYE